MLFINLICYLIFQIKHDICLLKTNKGKPPNNQPTSEEKKKRKKETKSPFFQLMFNQRQKFLLVFCCQHATKCVCVLKKIKKKLLNSVNFLFLSTIDRYRAAAGMKTVDNFTWRTIRWGSTTNLRVKMCTCLADDKSIVASGE